MSFLSACVRTGYVSAGHSAPGNLKGPARRSLGPVSVWKYGRKPAPGLPTVGTNSGAIVRKSRLDKLPDAFSSSDCGGAGRPAGRTTRGVAPHLRVNKSLTFLLQRSVVLRSSPSRSSPLMKSSLITSGCEVLK